MIKYTFEFADSDSCEFTIDTSTTSSAHPAQEVPDWVRLQPHKCEHCSLPPEQTYCPAALAIRPVVEKFHDKVSYETLKATVQMQEMTLQAETATQNAIRSVVGLLLALSDCPVTSRLRPLAHFHLPFTDREHTVFRVFGMYLLAQHMRQLDGLEADWNLDSLLQLYKDLHQVNVGLADRLRSASVQDANVNSIIILDTLAKAVELSFERSLDKLRPVFEIYLR